MFLGASILEAGIIGAALAAGLLSFFSPCILPLLPVYIGLLSTDASNQELGTVRRAANTVAFVLGICVTFLILGLGAGAIGRALNNVYVSIACGIIIFVFGLFLAGFMNIPFLNREKRVSTRKVDASTVVGAFLLGLGFSFGWTPCIGPILGTILAMAAQQGTAAAGAALTLVYALGMSIPFLVITLASNALIGRVRKLNQYLPTIQKIGGILIAIMGLWMVFSQVHALSTTIAAQQANSTSAQEQTASQDDESSATEEITESNRWRYMTMRGVDGQEHQLQDYVGKPMYVKFWGTWCHNCLSELDTLAETAELHNTKGDVNVVSVVAPGYYGELEEDEFVEWAQERDLDFPILMDSTDELNQYFALSAYPTSLFVDSEGNVVLMRAGTIEPEELEEILAGLE